MRVLLGRCDPCRCWPDSAADLWCAAACPGNPQHSRRGWRRQTLGHMCSVAAASPAGWCWVVSTHPPQPAVILTCPEPQAEQRATRREICSPVVDRDDVSCQTLSHELLSLLASSKGFGWGIGTVLALRHGLAAECLLDIVWIRYH